GALAANEEIAQIVSSVVLAKAAQAVPDFALGRDDFKPQREITRIAIAQDLRPACIGGQIAPYGAASLGRETERKQPAGAVGGFLDRLQNAAGLDDHGVVFEINVADAVEPGQ